MWQGPVCQLDQGPPADRGHGCGPYRPRARPHYRQRGVTAVRQYLEYVHDQARARFDAGMNAFDAARDTSSCANIPRGLTPSVSRVNVDSLYREFAGESVLTDIFSSYSPHGGTGRPAAPGTAGTARLIGGEAYSRQLPAVLALSLFGQPSPLAAEDARPSRHTVGTGWPHAGGTDQRTVPAGHARQPAAVDGLHRVALREVYGRWPRNTGRLSSRPPQPAPTTPYPGPRSTAGARSGGVLYHPNASADELRHTWTGYHELAHLLIPYRGLG